MRQYSDMTLRVRRLPQKNKGWLHVGVYIGITEEYGYTIAAAANKKDGVGYFPLTDEYTKWGYFNGVLELVFISKTWYNSSMKEVRAGRKLYPTDLTDSQWEEIEPLYSGMRNRKWSKRELTNAVLYIVKTGCQWRQLPHDFPPYQTVYSFFSRGAKSGLWEKILAHLV